MSAGEPRWTGEALAAMREPMRDRHAINFSWLLALRWGAIVGQVAIILAVDLVAGIALPVLALLAVVGVEAASNLAGARWAERVAPDERAIGALMGFDVLIFTALLYLSGGPLNPFSFLYLVYIALAAVVLPQRWAWALSAFSLACFGALFIVTQMPSVDVAAGGAHAEHLRMHLQGMWFAFAVAAGFIVYFVQRVTSALAAREAELSAARSLTARNEKLASLATLAAGAAHQLATPLSTIAVVARELENHLQQRDDADAATDARLIREQVERCRDILLQMAADAGESTGEPLVSVRVEALLEAALRGLREGERVHLAIDAAARGASLYTPLRSVAQALRAVVKNALEASAGASPVEVHVGVDADRLSIEVRDRGEGMSAEVLQRVGEPFYTTKGPDRGMGLGLFLTRTVAERLGGRLDIDSVEHQGTRVALRLPRQIPATIDRIGERAPSETR